MALVDGCAKVDETLPLLATSRVRQDEGLTRIDDGLAGQDETWRQMDVSMTHLVEVMAICHHEAAVRQASAVTMTWLAEQTLVLEHTLY